METGVAKELGGYELEAVTVSERIDLFYWRGWSG